MQNEPREAARYVTKISDTGKRFDILLKLGYVTSLAYVSNKPSRN